MKRTINYLFAALTLIAAASCTKDFQPNKLNDGQSELRTIELSFEDSGITKVGVSDRTPQWQAGDKIWLSNGATSEEVTLASEDITANVAKISTSLSGTLYAVYPASAQNGVIDDSGTKKIGFKIPTSTDGAFGNAHIAVAEGTTALTFKNIVSILKITTEAATTLVNISSASAIAGEFKVTYDTRNVEAGTTQAKSINITSSAAGEKYVAVASGLAFNALEFTAVKTATNWASKKSAQTTDLGINTMYNIGEVSGWSYTTNGSLWAKFSVAADKQVRFSKGNLQATCTAAGAEGTSTYSWAFAEHQYDYISNTEGNTTIGDQKLNSKVDLFGWVGASSSVLTGNATKYGISTSTTSADYGNNTSDALKADWGTAIDNKGTWSTLSSTDWTYLLNTKGAASDARTDANRFAKAMVNGVIGLIIFPDGYNGGTKITDGSITGVANVNVTGAAFPVDNVTDWQTMESAGCVFLPAAGGRSDSGVSNAGSRGYYWSSTPKGENDAHLMNFHDSNILPANNQRRYYGRSVRLVCAVQ